MEMAQIYNKALTKAYNTFIRDPVLTNQFHVDPNTATQSQINKIAKTSEFKSAAAELIDRRIQDQERQIFADIHVIIGETADSVMNARPNINPIGRQEIQVPENDEVDEENMLN